MRQSLVSNLLFLFAVLASTGQSLAQEISSSSPPPSIAGSSSNETELLRRLRIVQAKTVFLVVQLEPEALEGPKPPDRREKQARESLDLAVFLETRLKVVKSRKDADLTFLLVEGNGFRDSHLVSTKKLLVLPGGPADGDLQPLWESHWHEGEIGADDSADGAVTEFREAFEDITPEMWIGAQSLSQRPQDGEEPGSPILTAEERRDVLISAKTVAVLSFGPLKRKGTLFESFLVGDAPPWELADATRARADAESVLRKWNRHSLMEDPRNADLLLVIMVWNEVADKVGRIHHQKLVSGLKIYRGRTLFGKPQPPLWSGVERAYTGRSTKHVVEHLRKDIEDLMKQSPQKETASPAQPPPKTDP